jgi:hypothetical protein
MDTSNGWLDLLIRLASAEQLCVMIPQSVVVAVWSARLPA